MVSSVLIVIVISYLLIDVIYARANKSTKRWDSNGWRMNFSVRYSDFVVYINSKGVEIEWIYEQLMSLTENKGDFTYYHLE